MTTITIGEVTITPSFVREIRSNRESGNVVHPILGRSSPDVTLRPASLRAGEIVLCFRGPTAEAASSAAEVAHASAQVCVLASTETSTSDMSYVVAGRITREFDYSTRRLWTVAIEYQEIES